MILPFLYRKIDISNFKTSSQWCGHISSWVKEPDMVLQWCSCTEIGIRRCIEQQKRINDLCHISVLQNMSLWNVQHIQTSDMIFKSYYKVIIVFKDSTQGWAMTLGMLFPQLLIHRTKLMEDPKQAYFLLSACRLVYSFCLLFFKIPHVHNSFFLSLEFQSHFKVPLGSLPLSQ